MAEWMSVSNGAAAWSGVRNWKHRCLTLRAGQGQRSIHWNCRGTLHVWKSATTELKAKLDRPSWHEPGQKEAVTWAPFPSLLRPVPPRQR